VDAKSTMVVGTNTQAARGEGTAKQKLTVYLVNDANVPSPALSRARTLAAEMFATGVGVRIDWRAGQRTVPALERKVTVCVDPSADGPQIRSAQGLASKLFARIGVRIDWRELRSCPDGENALRVSLSYKTPPDQRPGALAYALPYERSHIVLFYDRIQKSDPDLVKQGLAYVLVHEVTHMLEGITRHSKTGIMKAQWDREDHFEIALGRLQFAPEDVDLIYHGLDTRASAIVAVPEPVAVQ
jgi:hypothetical protein